MPNQPESLWRNQDYIGWWTGNTVSAIGSAMSAIAFPLLVLYSTGSVALAGIIGAAGMVGVLATTLVGGALADRLSRKGILVLTPLIQAGAMAVVAIRVRDGGAAAAWLVGASLVSGAAQGLRTGASTPTLRRIVTKDQLSTATAQAHGRAMAAEFVGAPLGGLLFSLARWIPFAADAMSFLFSSVGSALIRRPLGPDRPEPGQPRTGVLADIRTGFGYVRRNDFLRFVLIWASLLNVVFEGFVLLLIALVRVRGGSPAAVGGVNAIALFGGVAGAAIAPLVLRRFRARLAVIVTAWAFAASVALLAFAPGFWQISTILMLTMITVAPMNVAIDSYRVRIVPDALSGRVTAVLGFGAQSLQWLGPLAAGLLASAFGIVGGLLALAAALVPLAISLHLTRSLSVMDRPVEDVEEVTEAGVSPQPLELAT